MVQCNTIVWLLGLWQNTHVTKASCWRELPLECVRLEVAGVMRNPLAREVGYMYIVSQRGYYVYQWGVKVQSEWIST